MSDTMLFGILRMPFDLAMSDEISRHQYWQRGIQAADEIEKLRADLLIQQGCCDGAAAQDAHIQREREEHNAEVERLCAERDEACDEGDLVRAERNDLLSEVERLREALRKIASERHFQDECWGIARKALEDGR